MIYIITDKHGKNARKCNTCIRTDNTLTFGVIKDYYNKAKAITHSNNIQDIFECLQQGKVKQEGLTSTLIFYY